MSKTTIKATPIDNGDGHRKRVHAVHFQTSIRHHMGNVHVLTSVKDVDEQVRRSIDIARRAHPEWILDKRTEDAMVRYALRVHADNLKLYKAVQAGTVQK